MTLGLGLTKVEELLSHIIDMNLIHMEETFLELRELELS